MSQNKASGKNIVILSTEPWGKMLVSKMHFAIELSKMGNKVYFVNPPRDSDSRALATVAGHEQSGNLVIINTRTIRGSLFFRYKLYFVYRKISESYINAIRKIVGAPIQEVWCFDPNFYVDLSKFRAERTALLLYDFYRGKHVLKTAETAGSIITISKVILDYYNSVTPPKLLLQHGLGKYFAEIAIDKIQNQQFNLLEGGKIKVGYMGNLLKAGMNTPLARKIIEQHPDKEFHIWGPYSVDGNNVHGSASEIPDGLLSFIAFLKDRKNVFLHGIKEQASLAKELSSMDAFLFLYSASLEMNGASNSHKLLEYLSTGKAVISTYVSNYAGTDLLIMGGRDEDDGLPEMFEKVMSDLPVYNGIEKQKQRITFALDNTYSRQVERIQKFIYG